MSTASSANRPALSSEIEEPLLAKPISKLALLTLVLGIFCLLIPIAPGLLAVGIVTTVIGLVTSFLLARNGSQHTGGWAANLGLFLAISTATWGFFSSKQHRESTGELAGKFAANFLETLAKGHVYQAAELQLPTGNRLLPGLDAQQYYESYQGSVSDDMMNGRAGGSPDPRALAKRRLIDLRESTAAKYLQKYPNATWVYESILQEVFLRNNIKRVKVLMSNSESPNQKLTVLLERQEYVNNDGQAIADWFVKETNLID